jgi:hypothetical protein
MQDVTTFKRDQTARVHLLNWLKEHGVKGIDNRETTSDHYVAACAAALGAWKWSTGNSAWSFRANPPYHPYDFVS